MTTITGERVDSESRPQPSPMRHATPPAPGTGRGTRRRLNHVDAMRPIKQAGVVTTHALIAFAPAGTAVAVGAGLMLTHMTREAFLFVSACMLAYSQRDLERIEHRSFWSRRLTMVAIPYMCWTLIYFLFFMFTSSSSASLTSDLTHLGYLTVTGYNQLYFLVVLLEFYALFPAFFWLLRRTRGHHGALMAASAVVQAVFVSLMHWAVLPSLMQGWWATREITSYQFYLVAGMVVAYHLEDVHRWLCSHARSVVGCTLVSAGVAEAWYYLAADHVVSWLGSASDPFQPIVIPFNVGAIACLYLIGVGLAKCRAPWARAAVRSGSDNAYGVYLAQMVFITLLGWWGWRHLNSVLPWPLVIVLSVAVVFVASMALTALLARTCLAKALTGRARVPWRAPRQAQPEGTTALTARAIAS